MLENLPKDTIPLILKNLRPSELGKLVTTCAFFKEVIYGLLYPEEWKDKFDQPFLFYVFVGVFDQMNLDPHWKWTRIQNEMQGFSRVFYTSKENLPFYKPTDKYYTVQLSPNELIHSKGFFPNKLQQHYGSRMGIDAALIKSCVSRKANNGDKALEEVSNPFFGKPQLSA